MALVDTPICNFGWQAPEFELPDTEGKLHKFKDMMGERGVLVAFICNHCPYVHAIIDRLVIDAKTLQEEGINVVAIMSNDYQNYPEDAPDKMKIFASKHDFSFPYLLDKDQSVGRAYQAVCTPDFFGFNNCGELQYRGRLDNICQGSDVTGNRQAELIEAMRLVVSTGKGSTDQKPSMGCSIKWKN